MMDEVDRRVNFMTSLRRGLAASPSTGVDRRLERTTPICRGLAALAVVVDPRAPPLRPQTAGPAPPRRRRSARPPPPSPPTRSRAPSSRWRLHAGPRPRRRGRQVRRRPPEAAPAGISGSRSRAASGKWRFGMGLQFGSMDPADDPNIPPRRKRCGSPTRSGRASRRPSASPASSARAGALPSLPPGPRGDRAHPPAQRALLRAAPARGPRARRQPHQGHERHRVHGPAGASRWPSARRSRSTPPSSATYYKTGSYDMSPLGLPDVDSGFEWGGRVGLAWQPFTALPPDPARRPMLVDPATGEAAATSAARRASRRLGRAAQLGLGDGRDVRDQLGRLDVQRVRARRELQPDQPAQLLGQLRGGLHLRC
ncbi:MAG: hypothetical protein MZU97_09400 [Bacillus subtilis]|nr:hypothetical protein [Bacillus subtilis]